MPSYDRTINLNEGTLTEVDMLILYPSNRVKVVSVLPVWFVDNTQFGYSTSWDITPPINGTYTYNVYLYSQDEPTKLGEGVITLNVADTFENVDNCCSDENVNIVWLNRQGGIGNFIFTQRKDFEVKVGKDNTFITGDIIKRSEIKGVYDGMTVYCTGLTKTMVDFLDTLRYSIQAWVFNDVDNTFEYILLDIGSFTKYNTKEDMYDVNVSFIFAKQKNIQRQ